MHMHIIANENFSNVEIVLIPKNATSKVQQLDRGVIRLFECNYKNLYLQTIVFQQQNEKIKISIKIIKFQMVTNNTSFME